MLRKMITKKTNVSNTDKKFKIKSKNSDLNIKAGEF